MISDDAKARHIYTQVVAQLEDVLDRRRACVDCQGCNGEGKTQKVGRGFRDKAEQNGQSFVALTHRSALVMELCDRLKLTPYKKKHKNDLNEGAKAKDIFSFFWFVMFIPLPRP